MQSIFNFHSAVCKRLKDLAADEVEILLSPEFHDPIAFSKQFYVLHSSGFKITECNLSYSILVDKNPLIDRMAYGNQKRFRKCEKAQLISKRLSSNSLSDVYSLLRENRESKGHQMSMTLKQLEEMHFYFQMHFFFLV